MSRLRWSEFLEHCTGRQDGVAVEAGMLLATPAGQSPAKAERLRQRLAPQGEGAADDLTALLAEWRAQRKPKKK